MINFYDRPKTWVNTIQKQLGNILQNVKNIKSLKLTNKSKMVTWMPAFEKMVYHLILLIIYTQGIWSKWNHVSFKSPQETAKSIETKRVS